MSVAGGFVSGLESYRAIKDCHRFSLFRGMSRTRKFQSGTRVRVHAIKFGGYAISLWASVYPSLPE